MDLTSTTVDVTYGNGTEATLDLSPAAANEQQEFIYSWK